MNKYYVYYHTDLNGKVFYVGKGSGDRAYSKVNRSSAWLLIAKHGYTVSFYDTSLSEKESLSLETEIIKHPLDWVLVNVVPEFNEIIISFEKAASRYEYSDISPSGLIDKITRKSVGSKSSSGYWNVQLDGSKVRAHRVVWVLHNNTIPSNMIINHIDSDKANNTITNLALCTLKENSNRRKDRVQGILQPNNTSGVLGVSEYTHPYTAKLYARAQWRDLGTGARKDKKFSYETYGKENAWKLAIEHRGSMIPALP